MRYAAAAAAFCATFMFATGSSAQEHDRYRLEKSEDGYVRMDTHTGEMSICTERSGQLVCELAADERAAYQRDIDALYDRLDELEERVAELESDRNELPSESEFEQSLSLMERFFRRFMGMIQEFERDFGPGEPADPDQQKT